MNTVMRLELNRTRTLLFWLAVFLGGYAGLMTTFYPRMSQNAEAMNKLLELWPKEMLAALSIEGNLMELGTFFNVYIFTLIWPWLAAIAGILIPTRTIAADLERGFLELPLSTPVSRSRYLLSAIAVQVAVMAVLVAAMIVPILICAPLMNVSLDPGRFAIVGLVSFAFGCAVAAATTLLSVVTLNRGLAGGLVLGVMLIMYMLQTVAKLAPELDALASVSAFRYYSPAPIIRSGTFPLGDMAVLGGIAAILWLPALWAFRRRDLIA